MADGIHDSLNVVVLAGIVDKFSLFVSSYRETAPAVGGIISGDIGRYQTIDSLMHEF